MERDPAAVLPVQRRDVHAFRLQRVHDVEPDFDQIGQYGLHCAVAVEVVVDAWAACRGNDLRQAWFDLGPPPDR